MRWFWQPKESPNDEVSVSLEEARQQRIEAQRKLRESQIAANQVRQAVIKARLVRADNQFSSRLDQAFRSRPSG